jgi:hypothetical protein
MQGFDEFVNNQAGAETNDPDGSFDGFVKAQTPSSPPSFDDFVQKQPKPKRMKRFDGGLRDDDVPRIVDEELRNLGWSDNARLSMLGNLGRENSWKANTIFAGHKDPKNAANNLGIISWQKERRDNLVNYLQKNGGDLTPNEKNLRLMARFMDDEMKGSNEWRDIHQKVRNPNLSTKEASQLFRRYIKYVPTAPYNTPDDEFDVVNNRKWAEKARSLGIGGNQPLNASPQSYAPVPQNVPRVEVEVGETLASPLPKDPQAPITENWSPFEKPSPQVPSPTVPGTQTIKSPKLNAQEYMTDSKGNKYFSADQTDVLPGYTRVKRTDEGGEEQFFLLDPKNNILPESAVTEFGVKRYDSEGLEYLPTQDPKVFQRFDKVGNPTNYIFNDDGTISREGVAALPDWVQGKRAPVTPINDKVMQRTLEAMVMQGVPDSEELRQRIVQGYAEVAAGQKASIFTDDDHNVLNNLNAAKQGVLPAEVGTRRAAPVAVEQKAESRPFSDWLGKRTQPTTPIEQQSPEYQKFLADHGLLDTEERRRFFAERKGQITPADLAELKQFKAAIDKQVAAEDDKFLDDKIVYKVDISNRPADQDVLSWKLNTLGSKLYGSQGIPQSDTKAYFSKYGFSDLESGEKLTEEEARKREDFVGLTQADLNDIKDFSNKRRQGVNDYLKERVLQGDFSADELKKLEKEYDVSEQGIQEFLNANPELKAERERRKQVYEQAVESNKTDLHFTADLKARLAAGWITQKQYDEISAKQDEKLNQLREIYGKYYVPPEALGAQGDNAITREQYIDSQLRYDIGEKTPEQFLDWYVANENIPYGQKAAEAVKNLYRTIPKAVSTAFKMGGIAMEYLDRVGKVYETSWDADPEGDRISKIWNDPKLSAAKRGLTELGDDLIKKLDREAPQDPILRENFWTTIAPDAIGQVITQVGIGLATGGAAAPLLFGASQGAVEQYEQAEKAGATTSQKLLVTSLGGLFAVPDALLGLKFAGLKMPAKLDFLSNLKKSIFTRLAGEVGETEAKLLTESTLRQFVRALPKKAVEGGILEAFQESSEGKLNRFAADLTYKNKSLGQALKNLATITKEDIEEWKAGFVGGVGGGTIETALTLGQAETAKDQFDKETAALPEIKVPEGAGAAIEPEIVPTGQETTKTDAPFFTIQGLDGRVLVEMQDEAEFRKAEADITSKLLRGELRENDYEDYVMRTYGQQPVEAPVAPSQQSPADIPVEVEDWLKTAATDQQQTGLDLGFDVQGQTENVQQIDETPVNTQAGNVQVGEGVEQNTLASAKPKADSSDGVEKLKADFGENIQKGGSNAKGVFVLKSDPTRVVKVNRQWQSKDDPNEGTLQGAQKIKELAPQLPQNVAKVLDVQSDEKNVYTVMERASGAPTGQQAKFDENALEITKNVAAIPQEHFDQLVRDFRALEKLKVAIDPSKSSNLFYDPKKGFQILDIQYDERGLKNATKDYIFALTVGRSDIEKPSYDRLGPEVRERINKIVAKVDKALAQTEKPAEPEEKIKSFKQPKPGSGGVKFNPKKDSLSKFVVASGGIAPSNTIDLEAIVNANVNKKGKQKGGFASLIRKDGASVEDMFRMAVEAGFFADKNTQYSPGAEDAANQNYDFTVDDFVQAVARDAGIAPDKDGNLVPGKIYTAEALNLISDTLTELENDHHNRQKEEQEKQEEMATKLDAVYQNPEVIKLLAEIERKGEATDEQESQLEDILYDAGLPQDFAASIIHELTKSKTDARQVQDDAGATGFEPEIDSPIFQDEEIEDAAFDDFNNLDTADEGDLDFDFADEEKPAEQSKPPADLFGNELEAKHQDSLFGKGELAETETGFNQANIEATRKAFGNKTADFLGQMLHSKDKSVRVVAETVTERGKLVEAKGDQAKQIVEDVSDALDVFRTAKEQKSTVGEVLLQPRLDGVQISDAAQDFARAMEAGNFAKKFDAALSEAKTTAKAEEKSEIKDEAKPNRFVQTPYKDEVLDTERPAPFNEVEIPSGETAWSYAKQLNKGEATPTYYREKEYQDQLAFEAKEKKKDEGKRTEEKRAEKDGRSEPAVVGDSDRPGLATYYEGSIPDAPDRTTDGIGKNLYPHQKQGVNLAVDAFLTGKKGFFLGDGAGAGKTRQIIGFVATVKKEKPNAKILVVSTKDVIKGSFQSDAAAFGIPYRVDPSGYGHLGDTKIINDAAFRNTDLSGFDIVVFDEVQKARNYNSQVSKNFQYFQGFIFAASATPFDTAAQSVILVAKMQGKSVDEFLDEYEGRIGDNRGQETIEIPEAELPRLLRDLNKFAKEFVENGQMLVREYPFYGSEETVKISHKAQDSLSANAVGGNKITHSLEEASGQVDAYWDWQLERLRLMSSDDIKKRWPGKGMDEIQREIRTNRNNELRKLTETFKATDEVIGLIEKDLRDGKQVVIYADKISDALQFHFMNATYDAKNEEVVYGLSGKFTRPSFFDQITKQLKSRGISFETVTGESKNRAEGIERFQKGGAKVVIVNQAGTTGINLNDTVGNKPRVLYVVGNIPSAIELEQLKGRVSRLNSKSPSEVRFVTTDSLGDDLSAGKVRTKTGVIDSFIRDNTAGIDERQFQTKANVAGTETVGTKTYEFVDLPSGKAFYVPNSFDIKDQLKAMGAKAYKQGGKFKGWMFPVGRKAEVDAAINPKESQPDMLAIGDDPVSENHPGYDLVEQKERDLLWRIPEQEFTSADTSINSSKLPTTFNFVDWQKGTKNADIGGGRFDNATEFLAEKGVTNVIFDPFNRGREHNEQAVRQIENGQSDTATVNNVLNVIQERENRRLVIEQAHNAVRPGGTAYFKIYEGARDNKPKQTSKGWQENRVAKDYINEIAEIFGPNVTTKGDIVIAKKSEQQPDMFATDAWHGSPHRFDKFELSDKTALTGEGAMAYGYGLYFAGNEEVADYYKKVLTQGGTVVDKDGKEVDVAGVTAEAFAFTFFKSNQANAEEAIKDIERMRKDVGVGDEFYDDAIKAVREFEKRGYAYSKSTGTKYKVSLAPEQDEYLLWDKPLSEQSEKVKNALKKRYRVGETTELNTFWEKGTQVQGWNKKKFLLTDKDTTYSNPEPLGFWRAYDNGKIVAEGETKQEVIDAVLNISGEDLYRKISNIEGGKQRGSELLKSLGIRGIKFLDGSSRTRGRDQERKIQLWKDEIADKKKILGHFENRIKSYPGDPVRGNYERDIERVKKEIVELEKELVELEKFEPHYNYVIFDDADVTIQEMFAIIGERGSQNLPDAQKRLLNLQLAKAMDNSDISDERIFLATGWEKGKDGKWRTELNDSRAKLTPLGKRASVHSFRGDLDEMLEFPELFKAYPELKDVKVEIVPGLETMGKTALDRSNPDSEYGEVKIQVRGSLSTSRRHSTVLHEVQHLVQILESFAMGGNSKMFKDGDDATAFEKYQMLAGEVEARNVEFRNTLTDAERTQNSFSATEDVPRERQITLTEDEMREIANGEQMMASDSREEQKRREAVKLLKTVPLPKLLPHVSITRTGNRIKLNLSGMELVRRAIEQVEINEGIDRKNKPYPDFLGMMPRDLTKIPKAIKVLEGIARKAESSHPDLARQITEAVAVLKEAVKAGERGSVLFHVADNKLPHELLHQQTFLGSVSDDLNEQHTEKGRNKLDNSEAFKKADDTFFSKKAEYSLESFRAKGFKNPEEVRAAVIREEIAAYIADGSWEELGLTDEQAEQYLVDFFASFGDKVYEDNIKLGKTPKEASQARADALARFGEIDYAKQAIDAISRAQDGTSGSGEGNVGSGEPQSPGTTGKNAGNPPKTQGNEGFDEPEIKKRKTVISAEEAGLLKEEELGGAGYYEVKSVDGNKREAQDRIDRLGLSESVAQAIQPVLDADPASLRQHGTFQMEVAQLLARKAEIARAEGDRQLADLHTRQKKQVITAIAEAGTDAGQFIRQLAEWRLFDPETAVEFVEKKRSQNGIGTPLTEEETEAIKQQAQEVADASKKVKETEAKVNETAAEEENLSTGQRIINNLKELRDLFFKNKKKDPDMLAIDGGELLAPNGKRSNLNPYLHKLVRTKAFKDWFGDWENDPKNASKVVDENGEPMVMYHGTNSDIKSFDKSKIRPQDLDAVYNGLWFTDRAHHASPAMRDPGNVMPVFLNVRKTLLRRDANKIYRETKLTGTDLREELQKRGFDGVVHDSGLSQTEIEAFNKTGQVDFITPGGTKSRLIKEDGDTALYEKDTVEDGWGYITGYESIEDFQDQNERVVVAFEPNQIKSVFNQGTFDKNNPDVLLSIFDTGQDNLPEVDPRTASDKIENAKKAFVTKIIQTAEIVAPGSPDEAVVGALALASKNAVATDLGKILRELFPEKYNLLPTDSAAEKQEKVEELRKTAAKAVQLNDLIKAKLKTDALRKRGITAEMEQQLKAEKRAQTNAMNRLRETAKALEKKTTALHVAAQVRRMSMVALVQTTATNIISTAIERYSMNKMIDTLDIAFQRLFKSLRDEGLNKDASIAEVWKTPKITETTIDEFGNEMSQGMSKHEVMLRLIDEHPEYYEAFYGRFSSDFSPGVVKKLDTLMFPLRWQEFLMRDIEGVNALVHRARQKKIDISGGIDFTQFDKEDVEFILNRVLELTYALRPDKRSGSGTDYVFATVLDMIRRNGGLDLLASEVAPFTGFMYNTVNKYKTKIPVIAQARLLYKTGQTASALKLAGNDHFIKEAIKENWTSRQLANQIWGMGVMALAVALVASLGDRDDWNYLRIPFTEGSAKIDANNPTGSYYFDVRTQPMFAPFVFLANKINRVRRGKDMFKSDKPFDIAGELAQAFTGLSNRAVFEGDFVNAAEYGAKWAWGKVTGADDNERNGERFVYYSSKWLGNTLGTLTNFVQFKTIKDLLAQFDTYEQNALNLDAHPFKEGIDRKLFESRRIFELIFSDMKARQNYATGDGVVRNEIPVLKILGLNLTDGNYITKEPTAAEITAKKLAFQGRPKPFDLADEKLIANVKRDFERESDTLRAAGDKEGLKALKTRLKSFADDGTLTPKQMDYAAKAFDTSDLQEGFKTLSAQVTVHDPISAAEQVWRKATEAEKEQLLPIYRTKLGNIISGKDASDFSKKAAEEALERIGGGAPGGRSKRSGREKRERR